jgi:hypothetical protein
MELCFEGRRDPNRPPSGGSQDNEATLANLLRQRQSHLVSPLPSYLQGAIVPVDIGETQLSYITRA